MAPDTQTWSASRCSPCLWPAAPSSSCSHPPSWAARWRSTTSGTTAPTTRHRSPREHEPTGTCCSLEGSYNAGADGVAVGGYTLSLNVLIPAVVVPGLLFTFLFVYRSSSHGDEGEREPAHVLDRPRATVRTGLGRRVPHGVHHPGARPDRSRDGTFHMYPNQHDHLGLRILIFVGPGSRSGSPSACSSGCSARTASSCCTARTRADRTASTSESTARWTEQERWLQTCSAHAPLEIENRRATDSRGRARATRRTSVSSGGANGFLRGPHRAGDRHHRRRALAR